MYRLSVVMLFVAVLRCCFVVLLFDVSCLLFDVCCLLSVCLFVCSVFFVS